MRCTICYKAHISLDLCAELAHNMRMKRTINFKKLGKWVDQVGGTKTATIMIVEKLDCSFSKAEKLTGFRYPSMLLPSEQLALAELTQISRDELFPFVSARGKAS